MINDVSLFSQWKLNVESWMWKVYIYYYKTIYNTNALTKHSSISCRLVCVLTKYIPFLCFCWSVGEENLENEMSLSIGSKAKSLRAF